MLAFLKTALSIYLKAQAVLPKHQKGSGGKFIFLWLPLFVFGVGIAMVILPTTMAVMIAPILGINPITASASSSVPANTAVPSASIDMLCPVDSPSISQRFGPSTLSGEPLVGGIHFHQGIDMAVPLDRPIKAASPGTVEFSGGDYDSKGKLTGYGYHVNIKDSQGRTELYGHMSQLEVKVNQVVQAGQEIGKVGTTGYSTGPHVHFGVKLSGQWIDPAPYLPTGCK